MKNLLACCGFALALLCSQQDAQGAIVVILSEVGSDVVAVGGGTLNLEALELFGSGPEGTVFIAANSSVILVGPGPVGGLVDIYSGEDAFVGPGSFGPGDVFAVTSGEGNLFGYGGALIVPQDYESGAALSGKSTWEGASFASLGVTPGTYVWTWGSEEKGTADSFTLQIVPTTPIPEPGTFWLFAMTGLSLMVFRRRVRG